MSLLENTDKIHTTHMGVGRIKRNLKLDTDDVVGYCISKIKDKNAKISRKEKTWFARAKKHTWLVVKNTSHIF